MSKLGLLFCSLVMTLVCYNNVQACDCVQKPDSVIENLDAMDAVFIGTVESISITSAEESQSYFIDNKIRIRLHEVFRKPRTSGKYLTVYTGSVGGGDCGYPFIRGRIYLIFASRIKGARLYTSICTNTKLLSDAGRDVQEIRKEIKRRRSLGSSPLTSGTPTARTRR
jgi:hypothetical protein